MEILSLVKDFLQECVEYVAGYRIGQVTLRHIEKMLWVLEKTARWAVPPPLDQDDRPQPELVRPLPWVFFFMLLIMLRVTRESISIVNLFRGKPPLRSADVVTYLQSQRRYIRALKYQGSRHMRARAARAGSTSAGADGWLSSARSLLDFTMCFRRPAQYGNNNTTQQSNNDEVMVMKKSPNDDTMERLIEKMMADLNTDTDDDSSYTLTNAPSVKSENSDDDTEANETLTSDNKTIITNISTSTPKQDEEKENREIQTETPTQINKDDEKVEQTNLSQANDENNKTDTIDNDVSQKNDVSETTKNTSKVEYETSHPEVSSSEDALMLQTDTSANFPKEPKEESQNMIEKESAQEQKKQSPPKKQKIANGQVVKSAPKRKKGSQSERRDSNVPVVRITLADDGNNNGTEDVGQVQNDG